MYTVGSHTCVCCCSSLVPFSVFNKFPVMYLAGVSDPSALTLHVFENTFSATSVLKSPMRLFGDTNFCTIFPEC